MSTEKPEEAYSALAAITVLADFDRPLEACPDQAAPAADLQMLATLGPSGCCTCC